HAAAALIELFPADGVEDHVRPFAAGQFLDLVLQAVAGIVDERIGAVLLCDCELFIGTGRSNHPRSKCFADFNSRQSHSAGRPPPAAPGTSRVSPDCSWARCFNAWYDVPYTRPNAAATSKPMESGIRPTAVASATARSAMPPMPDSAMTRSPGLTWVTPSPAS